MDIKLIMFREDGQRRDFPLTAASTVIGRKKECDIRIPLTEVSRRHVEFRVDDAGVMVKDLGSANGTFVNNKKITEVRLTAGDHVVVGPVVFTVQIDGSPQEVRPVRTKLHRHKLPSLAQEKAAAIKGSALPPDIAEELDPISALEALASSADQTAIEPLSDDELL